MSHIIAYLIHIKDFPADGFLSKEKCIFIEFTYTYTSRSSGVYSSGYCNNGIIHTTLTDYHLDKTSFGEFNPQINLDDYNNMKSVWESLFDQDRKNISFNGPETNTNYYPSLSTINNMKNYFLIFATDQFNNPINVDINNTWNFAGNYTRDGIWNGFVERYQSEEDLQLFNKLFKEY